MQIASSETKLFSFSARGRPSKMHTVYWILKKHQKTKLFCETCRKSAYWKLKNEAFLPLIISCRSQTCGPNSSTFSIEHPAPTSPKPAKAKAVIAEAMAVHICRSCRTIQHLEKAEVQKFWAATQTWPAQVTSTRWCDGLDDLFSPLSYLCPESCGCRDQITNQNCPLTCAPQRHPALQMQSESRISI